MIAGLVKLLINGWRLSGNNEIAYFGHALSIIDQETYGRLILLQAILGTTITDLRSSHGELLAQETRLAARLQHPPLMSLVDIDAAAILEYEVEATDKISQLNLPANMRVLLITFMRSSAVEIIGHSLLDESNACFRGQLNLILDGMIPDEAKGTLRTAIETLFNAIDNIRRSKRQLIHEYDARAAMARQLPLARAIARGVNLIISADSQMVTTCESWSVNGGERAS